MLTKLYVWDVTDEWDAKKLAGNKIVQCRLYSVVFGCAPFSLYAFETY